MSKLNKEQKDNRKVILLVDGDILAFRSAAAQEERSILAKHLKSGREKVFKNRTELKDLLKSKNMKFNSDDYSISDIQQAKELKYALYSVKNTINMLSDFVKADEIRVYVGGGENFRHRLPIPSPYKAGRGETIKPLLLEETRDYIFNHYKTTYCKEIEADDALSIEAYKELAKGNRPIIASIDKDTYQAQGIEILNWIQEPMKIELIPSVGELYESKGSIKGNGLKFLVFQVVIGDSADTYFAYKLSDKPCSPKTVMQELNEIRTEVGCIEYLINKFKYLFPDEICYTCVNGFQQTMQWYDLLEIYWKLAYMKRSYEDESNCWLYFSQYGDFTKEKYLEL